MRDSLSELVLIPRDVVRAGIDKVFGRNRRRYEHSIYIRAPRQRVWQVSGALSLINDTITAQDLEVDTDTSDPAVQIVTLKIDGEELRQTIRVIDQRENEGFLMEIVAGESDPRVVWGDRHYVGIALADAPGGTILTQFAELTFTAPYARLLAPYTVRDLARRTKKLAEAASAST